MERHLKIPFKTTINSANQGIKSYNRVRYPNIPENPNDLYLITTVGDRVDTLAYEYYNDTKFWWVITTANPNVIRRDSFHLKAGIEIRIPTNLNQVLRNFERINQ
tara:strand:+ start:1391 stop:1705 length:315 start_codon:yes stop_codon:yes gene_type:complete